MLRDEKLPKPWETEFVIAHTKLSAVEVRVDVDYNVTYKTCWIFTALPSPPFATSVCMLKP